DPATGALRAVRELRPLPDPSYLALTPDGAALCAVGETADGAVRVLSLADPAAPEPTGPPVPVAGAAPTHLAVTGRRIYTANYTSGSVSGVGLAGGTVARGPATVVPHHGSGPVTERQEGPHAHGVTLSPDGAWLLCADLGTDSVWIHAVDPADGTHRPHGELRLRPGTGPRHLVFHPAGHTVYVVNELDPTVTACHWDGESGTLTVAGETPLPTVADGDNYPSGLAVTPDGTRLYVAVRGADHIAVLDLGPDGAAAVLGAVDCGGHWPRGIALDADGTRLYVANERSGDVSWFALDQPGGLPRRLGSLTLPAPTCVVIGR
ncbi:lactonase family protein, partial [Streptomyces sp. SM12]